MADQESDLYLLAWQRVKQLTNDELICFIQSKNAVVRDLVIREFHTRPSREVFEIAASLVREKKTVMRVAGYLILGQLGTPDRPYRDDSMPLLMHGLDSEKTVSVLCAIAYAVGHLAPPRALHEKIVDGLSRCLDQKVKPLQVAVAFAVAGLSISDRLDRLLKKLLSGGDQDVKEWVGISLDAIRSREAKR